MDALRFTHAAQMMLMQTHWPTCAHEYCGLSLPSADGRMLFQGPRVCMAVHEASEYLVSVTCPNSRSPARCAAADGIDAAEVCCVCHE
jgi:hypothetical protein